MITKIRMDKRRNAGLTLMELLISLALMALIAAGIMSSTALALRIYDRSETLLPQSEPVVYRLHLRHWLGAAVPDSLLTPFPSSFIGATDHFEFTTLSQTPFFPDAAAMQVRVEKREQALFLTVAAMLDDGSVSDSVDVPLVTDAANVRLEYLQRDDAEMNWLAEWPADVGLPNAVRVTVGPGSSPTWPDFIVRLKYAQ